MSKNIIMQLANEQHFSTTLKPSQLSFDNWFVLFNKFAEVGNEKKVAGSLIKMLSHQTRLRKSHRTRVDRGWRKFAK